MPSSPNEAAARETIVPTETGYVPGSSRPNHRKTWRFWSGCCFAIVLLAAFARPLLALVNYASGSELYSYILLVPFVSAYLLYLRRDELPKTYVADLPLAIAFLTVGLGVMAFTYSSIGLAPADNAHLVLLTLSFLSCLAAGGFFFSGVGGCEQPLFLWPISFSWCPCRMRWRIRLRPLRNLPRRR